MRARAAASTLEKPRPRDGASAAGRSASSALRKFAGAVGGPRGRPRPSQSASARTRSACGGEQRADATAHRWPSSTGRLPATRRQASRARPARRRLQRCARTRGRCPKATPRGRNCRGRADRSRRRARLRPRPSPARAGRTNSHCPSSRAPRARAGWMLLVSPTTFPPRGARRGGRARSPWRPYRALPSSELELPAARCRCRMPRCNLGPAIKETAGTRAPRAVVSCHRRRGRAGAPGRLGRLADSAATGGAGAAPAAAPARARRGTALGHGSPRRPRATSGRRRRQLRRRTSTKRAPAQLPCADEASSRSSMPAAGGNRPSASSAVGAANPVPRRGRPGSAGSRRQREASRSRRRARTANPRVARSGERSR